MNKKIKHDIYIKSVKNSTISANFSLQNIKDIMGKSAIQSVLISRIKKNTALQRKVKVETNNT